MAVDLVVETEHSRYEFDDAKMTVARHRVHPDANDLGDDGEARHYVSATAPKVGRPMWIHYTVSGQPKLRTTTPVVRVLYRGGNTEATEATG